MKTKCFWGETKQTMKFVYRSGSAKFYLSSLFSPPFIVPDNLLLLTLLLNLCETMNKTMLRRH